MMNRPFNRDQMANADRKAVANATMGVIDGVQRHPVETRPLAMAAAFTMLCRELGVEPQDAFTMAHNIMVFRDSGNTVPEFAAARDYLKNEL